MIRLECEKKLIVVFITKYAPWKRLRRHRMRGKPNINDISLDWFDPMWCSYWIHSDWWVQSLPFKIEYWWCDEINSARQKINVIRSNKNMQRLLIIISSVKFIAFWAHSICLLPYNIGLPIYGTCSNIQIYANISRSNYVSKRAPKCLGQNSQRENVPRAAEQNSNPLERYKETEWKFFVYHFPAFRFRQMASWRTIDYLLHGWYDVVGWWT